MDLIERQAAKEKTCSMCRWEGTENCEECEHPIDDIPSAPRWVPCSERLPKPDQVVDHVVKYFLVQDEYGDMMVASYQSNERGKTWWEQMNSFHAIQDEIVAWQELPKPWKGE